MSDSKNIPQERKEFLWELFEEESGVLRKEESGHWEKDTYGISGHDFIRVVKWFVYTELLSEEEMVWLKSQTEKVQVPDGFVRLKDETNTLRPLLPIPGQKDELIVEYERVSHTGRIDHGGFRGHPSDCDVDNWATRYRRSIKLVTLNGVKQDSFSGIGLSKWKNPDRMAGWALEIANEPVGPQYWLYREALAEVYRQKLTK